MSMSLVSMLAYKHDARNSAIENNAVRKCISFDSRKFYLQVEKLMRFGDRTAEKPCHFTKCEMINPKKVRKGKFPLEQDT